MKNKARIIDCDIHPYVSEQCPIEPFVPASLRLAVEQGLANRPTHGYSNPFGLIRRDAHCQSARQLVDEHLDKFDIEFCVLQPPGVGVSQINNIDVANGMAEAWNDWQIENYLKRDQRILGSICVNMADPPTAVREIRRMAKSCPRMVQVIVPGESRELYGHRQYYPVYEACEELGLPLGLHPGQEGSLGSATPVGRPSSYFEWHTIIPLTFQAHTVSMICEGVFERFPRLHVVLVEGGISWLPPLLWRLDKNYKALRSTVPWLKEPPSEYALRHVRLTTQPIEEPPQKGQLAQMFRMVQADRTVLFSSDYPHWDYDDPVRSLPADLGDDTIRRIMYDNAFALFRLERFSDEVARPTV
jgi:predicted TIM-barrel fold metal-dependent hydrolase